MSMTREMAIQILSCYGSNYCWENGESIPAEAVMEAVQMAIEALKAQEPVEPVFERQFMTSIEIYDCGKCGTSLGAKGIAKYCMKCGQAVKWE